MTIIGGKKHLVWRLLCSDFLSNLATSLAAKIISLWFVLAVFGEERSVPWVSGFLTVIAVAQLLAGLFTGAVSDRHDPIATMTMACLVRAVASAGIIAILVFCPTGGLAAVLAVIALAVIEAMCDTAYLPAAASVSHRLADGQELVRLLSWLRFFALMGSMAGPILAGIGADRGWFAGTMALETVALLVAALILAPIRHSMSRQTAGPAEGFWLAWKAGLRAMVGSESYRVMLPFAILEAVSSSALSMVAIYFFTATLHVSATWYGVWNALVAAGYAIGYLTAPWLSERMRFFKLLALSNPSGRHFGDGFCPGCRRCWFQLCDEPRGAQPTIPDNLRPGCSIRKGRPGNVGVHQRCRCGGRLGRPPVGCGCRHTYSAPAHNRDRSISNHPAHHCRSARHHGGMRPGKPARARHQH